ncbi:MAG: glycosyltransferase [Candidatus Aminicenantes bacterium]|nr:glycosyltransferase [Candidatus Aminicenantes bacterium]
MSEIAALFLPRIGYGGITANTLKLAKALKNKGYQIHVITTQIQRTYIQKKDLDFPIICLKANRIITSLPYLISYLRKHRPAALISAHYYANIIAVWAKALASVPTRLIITERSAPAVTLASSGNLKDRFIPWIMQKSYPKADAVVAVSKGTADNLSKLIKTPSHRVKVIYNPIFRDKISDKAREKIQHPWFGNDQLPVILGMGYYIYQKDFSTLIRAFSVVRQEIPARLVIIGEGREQPRLEKLAQKLGISKHVDLHPFVKNPYKYMAGADLFALSSRFEGMPNVLVEAVAVGTPCVATDCPSGPNEILPPEALVPVEDFRKMAQKIITLLKNKNQASRIVMKAQQNLTHFDPDLWIQQYVQLIKP